jgi:hypothetical protein
VRTLISNQLSWVATRARSYTPGSLLGTSVPTGGAASMEPMFTEVLDLDVMAGLPGVGDELQWTHVPSMKPSFAQVTQRNSAEKRDGSGLYPWRPPE